MKTLIKDNVSVTESDESYDGDITPIDTTVRKSIVPLSNGIVNDKQQPPPPPPMPKKVQPTAAAAPIPYSKSNSDTLTCK